MEQDLEFIPSEGGEDGNRVTVKKDSKKTRFGGRGGRTRSSRNLFEGKKSKANWGSGKKKRGGAQAQMKEKIKRMRGATW